MTPSLRPALVNGRFGDPALFVEIARDGVYFLQTPDPLKLLVAAAWAVGTFTVGWFYFRARSMEISEEP